MVSLWGTGRLRVEFASGMPEWCRVTEIRKWGTLSCTTPSQVSEDLIRGPAHQECAWAY